MRNEKNLSYVSWWIILLVFLYGLKECLFFKINTDNLFRKNESIHKRETEARRRRQL
jgi:hypothetical protein